MSYELVEKTLIAASVAASEGHEHTSKAMIEFARDLEACMNELYARPILPAKVSLETGSDRPPDFYN